MKSLDIAICGAGIAGLAAAICLARQSHNVTIVERFDQPRAVGAGLMLQPTGLAALEIMGCRTAVEALGHRIDAIQGHTANGRTIFDLAYSCLDPAISSLGIHRGALFGELYRAAQATSINWLTGKSVASSVLAGNRRAVRDRTGETILEADLIIDATGMNSPLREGNAKIRLNRPYAYGAAWSALPLPSDWPHRHRLTQVYDQARIMIGILPIGTLPNDSTERAAFFWSLKTSEIDSWQKENVSKWKSHVRALWPATEPFLDHIKSKTDLSLARYADVWLEQPFADKLAFIGDAARSASPQLGQGANLALIDAIVLANAIASNKTASDALFAYAQSRRAHTRFYGFASKLLTPFFQSDSQVAARIRDATFAPMARIPYVRREMVRTLAGLKTGLFTHTTPAALLMAKDERQ